MQNLSKAKVSELDIEVLVKENVLGLDVSVNHPSPVTVLQRFCHLFSKVNKGGSHLEKQGKCGNPPPPQKKKERKKEKV